MVEVYAGLDVSDKATHLCVVDGDGKVLWREVCATDPQALATMLKKRSPAVRRVVLETGTLSAFLYHGLIERGMPAVCICARHAKGVLSARVNKSDTHDAEGLAQLARTGWFDMAAIGALAAQHRGGRAEHGRTLWQFVMLERSLTRLFG